MKISSFFFSKLFDYVELAHHTSPQCLFKMVYYPCHFSNSVNLKIISASEKMCLRIDVGALIFILCVHAVNPYDLIELVYTSL